MNSRSKYLFKNLGILTISNFSSKLMVFLLVPLYTSVLSTPEYGTYDLVVSSVSLLYPLLTVNIVDAVMRFCMDSSSPKNQVVFIGMKYICLSIGIIGFMLLGIQCFSIFPSLSGLKVYIFFYYLSYVFNQFFIQFAKGTERVKEMGVGGVLGTVVMIGGNILFLIVLKRGLLGFFIANILSQVIPCIYYFYVLKFGDFIGKRKINKCLEKKMLMYCLPLIFTVLGWWINSAADKYIVTFMCGIAANGLLSVSYKIPSIINTVQGIFMQAWQITAIKEYGGKNVALFYGKMFIYINVLMSFVCSLLIILTKPLAHLLYANDFYSAWLYVPFLLISSVINCASGFIGPILSAKKNSKDMALSAIYGALVNILLNFILIYFIGIQGATIATMISSFIIYIFRKISVKNELLIESYWKILLTWFLLVIQAIIEVYKSNLFLEIIIVGALLLLNYSVLKDALLMILKREK